MTPIRFPGELQGKFKLTVRSDGYETHRQTLNLYLQYPMELTLNLKPKTNIKAALRSLLIPGWGQMYSGRKGMGMIFTLLAAGATGYYIITDNNFYDKLDEYVRINSQYASAMTDGRATHRPAASSRPAAYASNTRRISSRTRRKTAICSSSLPVACAGSSKPQ